MSSRFEYFKLFIYGIITPSILSFAFYYTFSKAVKDGIKDGIKEALILNIFDIFDKKMNNIFNIIHFIDK